MTKRLTAALLCVLAMFAIGGVASADAKVLSYRTAKTLAKRLADKQVQGRDVVSYHLLLPRRVGQSRIVFQYDDRTADNVFCTALVIIEQRVRGRTTTITGRFADAQCNGIPSEVLKFEAAVRKTQRELRANTPATVDAVEDHGEIRESLTEDVDGARQTLQAFADAGIDYDDVVDTLEREGVEKFAKSFRELFSDLESKRDSLVAA
jgi:hypothetical protein